MKRSEINKIMQSCDDFIREHRFYLPPFAYWSTNQWKKMIPEAQEIIRNGLGWDITDFGSGNFEKVGLFLFTIRNGNMGDREKTHFKPYAEKVLVVDTGQITPMHFHWNKMEDIINRGGGMLFIQLYNSLPDDELDKSSDVQVSTDGVIRTVKPGDIIKLSPGESITLPQRLYHKFWGEGGRVLVGEVSKVNDDSIDNRFYEPVGRFPDIDEDAPPMHLLYMDYKKFLS